METVGVPLGRVLSAYTWPTTKDASGHADCVALNLGSLGPIDLASWTGASGEFYARWRYREGALDAFDGPSRASVGITQGYAATDTYYAYLTTTGEVHASNDWRTPPPAPVVATIAAGVLNLTAQGDRFYWNEETRGRYDSWSPNVGLVTLDERSGLISGHAESTTSCAWLVQTRASDAEARYSSTELWTSALPSGGAPPISHRVANLPINSYQTEIATGGDYAALVENTAANPSNGSRLFVVQLSTGTVYALGARSSNVDWKRVLGVGARFVALAEGARGPTKSSYDRIVTLDVGELPSLVARFPVN